METALSRNVLRTDPKATVGVTSYKHTSVSRKPPTSRRGRTTAPAPWRLPSADQHKFLTPLDGRQYHEVVSKSVGRPSIDWNPHMRGAALTLRQRKAFLRGADKPRWWNWQTRHLEGVVGVIP